jgi:hypothetical protein
VFVASIIRAVNGLSAFIFRAHILDDEGRKHLRNVGKPLPEYTAQHPRGKSG